MEVSLPAMARVSARGKGLKVEIVNISPQGLCFVCGKEFCFADKVELTVELQGMGLARLLTQVTWSGFLEKEKGYATGVKVIADDQEEREKFIRFYNLKLLYAVRQG
ncbi:MAG: hypothetical protein HGA80_02675 [Candidatus Omnitrophica bacterium]|nr:hypothetical protein [Candidatus Omnitrophota bacterium]